MNYPECGTLTYSSTTTPSVTFNPVSKEYSVYSVDINIAYSQETITLTGGLASGVSKNI